MKARRIMRRVRPFPRDIRLDLDAIRFRVRYAMDAAAMVRSRREKCLPLGATVENLRDAVRWALRPYVGHPDWPLFVALLKEKR